MVFLKIHLLFVQGTQGLCCARLVKCVTIWSLQGVGPRERATKKIPGVELDETGNITSYDIEVQCRSVFNNVRTIVEESGSSWDNIIDVTVFLTNMKDDFKIYNKVYAEFFADNQPCRTTLEINCLPTPIAIELKVIATIDPWKNIQNINSLIYRQ